MGVQQGEKFKLVSDYLKHLTTLSTGSIVLLAAFLERLFVQPRWRPSVVIALCGFMVSVVASVVAYTYVIYKFPVSDSDSDDTTISGQTWWGVSILATWIGFLVGVVSLVVFAVKNLAQ